MPVNSKRLLLSVGGSNSGLWIHTHQTVLLTGLEQNSSPNIAQTCYVCGKYVTILLEPTDKSIRYSRSKS
jgi:hypothetical protein